MSYDLITPSAARSIFEAILWKPTIEWKITKIEVMNPIRWISVRRNEVGKRAASPTRATMEGAAGNPLGIVIEDERQQRAGLFLRDVRYRLFGYFELNGDAEQGLSRTEAAAKYASMFERRVLKGQCFHRPYLGCREFACFFKLADPKEADDRPIAETRDLGYMLYDMDFTEDPESPKPSFFRAYLNRGVVITDRRQIEVKK